MEESIILALIGGSAGIISALTTLAFKIIDYIKAQKRESWEVRLETHLAPILSKIEGQEKVLAFQAEELRQIRLDTLRTQLYIKMEHEPHNHDTILKIAETYFLPPYCGDWVATADFQAWADKEKIKIPVAIMNAIAKNDGIKDFSA